MMNHRHSILPSRPLIPSRPDPLFPLPPSYFSSRLSSPTYSTGARLLLCASEHLPFLLEPLHLCQSSRGGLESRGVNFSLSHSPRLLFVGSAEILPSARISIPHTRALQRRPQNANEELLKELQISWVTGDQHNLGITAVHVCQYFGHQVTQSKCVHSIRSSFKILMLNTESPFRSRTR